MFKKAGFLLNLVMMFTVIIQFSFFESFYDVTRNVAIGLWLLLLVYNILHFKGRYNQRMRNYLMLMLFFNLYLIVLTLISGNNYFGSATYQAINISVMFFLIGYTSVITTEQFRTLIKCYVFLVTVLSVSILVSYFGRGIDLENQMYTYGSKNSRGPAILCAIACNYFLWNDHASRRLKWALAGATGVMTLTLFDIQNRASIMALVTIAALLLIYYVRKSPRLLVVCLAGIGALAAVYILNGKVHAFINWSLGIGKEGADLNSLSSGRVVLAQETMKVINENTMMGVGEYYFDNAVMNFLANYGAIAFLLFYLPMMWKPVATIPNIYKDHLRRPFVLVALMSVGVVVVSFFEALAPFGPGTTYGLFWVLLGYSENKLNSQHEMYFLAEYH
ncbi:MAG TPA: O-antigen ligase family protein [Chitinophaga sp.]